MTARLRRLWAQHPLLLLALALSILAFIFFGAKAAMEARLWRNDAFEQQPLQPWMTPRYVSHTYGIPQTILFPALGLGPDTTATGRTTLIAIAQQLGVDFADLVAVIEALEEDHSTGKAMQTND